MRLAKSSCARVAEYFSKNDTVILAIGSIENHGSHNVLGVDTLIPDRILELIEEKSDILIAPTVPYGACDSLANFPGTISLGIDVLYAVITKITQSLYAHGARKFLFLNGHGGNIATLDRVGLDLLQQGALCAQLNWWLMVWDINPAWKGGHGGAEETAGMLAVDPSLVDFSKLEEMNLINDLGDELPTTGFKGVRYKGVEIPVSRTVDRFTKNGWIGPDHPKEATVQWGTEMLQATADYIVDFISAFKKAPIA
jgi:creatinine amidohydrolase